MPDPMTLTIVGPVFGLFKGMQALSKTMTPKTPSYPSAGDPMVEYRREQQLRAELARRGRSSTILTGGGGLANEPSLGKATLLGS